MFRNVLAATLRNLVRNRLYAAISIGGLAAAMTVAILTALFLRDELTFDRFAPDWRHNYVLVAHFDTLGLRGYSAALPAEMAAPFRLNFPQAKSVARYGVQDRTLTQDAVEANETIGWIDPDFFALFPFKTLAGDLRTSVQQPDGAVLTRAMARKYFGVDTPVGRTFLVDRKTRFRVTAVIEDLPDNTNFAARAFLSGKSSVSGLDHRDRPYRLSDWATFGRTYFRLDDPAEAAAINRALPAFIDRRVFPGGMRQASPFAKSVSLSVIPDADLHLLKDTNGPEVPSGDPNAIGAFGLIAALIVLIAAINFVNLMTARAGRRSVEVGVRKASGAERRHLILQFMGESLLYALVGALAALALAELALPGLNALLGRRLVLDYWGDPKILPFVGSLALLVGGLAGVYPALILSSFRPQEVLKGAAVQTAGSAIARNALVGLQMAVLIALLLSVLVIARQTHFVMTSAVGLNTDQVLRVRMLFCAQPGGAGRRAFVEHVAQLPGVAAAACSNGAAVGAGDQNTALLTDDGRPLNSGIAPIDFGFFEVYGVKPLAGRLPSSAHGEADMSLSAPGPSVQMPRNVVINAGLAQALGFAAPKDAVGRSFRMRTSMDPPAYNRVTVIGVVPDTQFDLTKGPAKPLVYPVLPKWGGLLSVKIRAGRIPETLAAIDHLWAQLGDSRPIQRRFTDEYLNVVYAPTLRQGWLVGSLSVVAVFLSCLGLFGLASFTAERRTKEIGVRKAMGASSRDVAQLLLWSFSRPVLWANVIAWPLAWWALHHWLEGFARHVALEPWMFLAAAAAALFIALATVLAHTLRVASAKPVGALRYE